MSLVIAIKDKGRIVLGSDKQISTGSNKDHTSTKIWEVQELPGAIMGGVGTVRAAQIIQYSNIIDKNYLGKTLDTEFVVTSLVPTIAGLLASNGINCEDENTRNKMMPNAFIFAYKDRAWMIWNDLSVSEIEDCLSIGSGSDVARGALFATHAKSAFERIVTSIAAAAENTLFVDDGIDILTTEGREGDNEELAKFMDNEISFTLEPDIKKKKNKK